MHHSTTVKSEGSLLNLMQSSCFDYNLKNSADFFRILIIMVFNFLPSSDAMLGATHFSLSKD